jgi:hypothetical protein
MLIILPPTVQQAVEVEEHIHREEEEAHGSVRFLCLLADGPPTPGGVHLPLSSKSNSTSTATAPASTTFTLF